MPGKVVIFHPSVAPFVQQAARAFYEADLLERFYTTIRYDSKSWIQNSASALAALAGRDLRGLLRRRTVHDLPREMITAYPWTELMRLISGRFDASGRATDLAWEKAENIFSRKVGRQLRPGLLGVYGYEFSARRAFERARQLGLKTFYDVPAPEATYVEDLLRDEIARFPELKTEYTTHVAQREERRHQHRLEEWQLADVVVAASKFTRTSFARSGRDVSKLRIIPYGAPVPAPRDQVLYSLRAPGPVRFVWAGTFSVRKGAHYLVDAWRSSALGRVATLDVFGSVTLPSRLLSPTPEGMTFRGPVSRDDLLQEFRRADALVFPTLCDGFGMVVTEAWSQGLPVITTDRAGAVDLLREGENGILVPPGNSDALGTRLLEYAGNPRTLSAMREASLDTAKNWQWSDYRGALITTLRPHFRRD